MPGSSWRGLRYFAPSLLILLFLGSIRIGQVAAIAVTAPLIRHWVEKRSILNGDKELLQRAPSFDRDHWPNRADRAWGYRSFTFGILKEKALLCWVALFVVSPLFNQCPIVESTWLGRIRFGCGMSERDQ